MLAALPGRLQWERGGDGGNVSMTGRQTPVDCRIHPKGCLFPFLACICLTSVCLWMNLWRESRYVGCCVSLVSLSLSLSPPKSALLSYNSPTHTVHPFTMYNSVFFTIFTKLYNHYQINFRTCHHPKQNPLRLRQPLIFLSLWVCLFWTFPIMVSYCLWSFVSGLCHLELQGAFTSWRGSALHSFLWLKNILSYG